MNIRSEVSMPASSCLSSCAVPPLLTFLTHFLWLPAACLHLLCSPLFLLPRSSPSTLISQAVRISFMPGKDFFLPTPWARAVNNDNGSVVLPWSSLVRLLPAKPREQRCNSATLHAQSLSSVSDPAFLHFFLLLPPQTSLSPPLLLLCTALIVMLTRRSSVVSTSPTLSSFSPLSIIQKSRTVKIQLRPFALNHRISCFKLQANATVNCLATGKVISDLQ